MFRKTRASLSEQLAIEFIDTAKKLSERIADVLKPRAIHSVCLRISIYLYARADLELVRNDVLEGFRRELFEAFRSKVLSSIRAKQDQVTAIIDEEMERYGELFRNKDRGELFTNLHEYLYNLLTVAAQQSRPSLWRTGKDPIVLESIEQLIELRMVLGEIETNVIIPLEKRWSDTVITYLADVGDGLKGFGAVRVFFQRTDQWKTLPEQVTNAIAARLVKHEGAAFRELLHVVYTYGLIEKTLQPLSKEDGVRTNIVMGGFAEALGSIGEELVDQMLEDRIPEDTLKDTYVLCNEALRSAIVVEPNYFPAKLQLAKFHRALSDNEKAIKYWKSALVDLERLRSIERGEMTPFELSVSEDSQFEELKSTIEGAIAEAKE